MEDVKEDSKLGPKDESSKKETPNEEKPVEVKVTTKEPVGRKIGNVINYIISVIILIVIIFVAMTIKNALDDTMIIETNSEQEICKNESCILIDGYYEDGFVNWNVREYWPFFSIAISTDAEFKEGQEVEIVCPVDLKEDSFQHIWTKLNFLFQKDNIKECVF
ncbi:MAG: hypothetical protein U9Q67_00790 [Patescibacteria group bacterium]|nr:hypothetical protein [Patescibacteria group bacterium]